MTHPRKLIRDYVKATLKDGGTLAGKNVFTNKKHHIDNECLPQIVIHTEGESIELLDQAPKRYRRDMDLVIEVFAKGTTEEDCQDILDQLAWQIENLLADDDDWNETVNKTDISSVKMQFSETSTNPVGCCIMTYKAQYLTELPVLVVQKTAALTDLNAIQGSGPDFGWDIVTEAGDPDGSIEAGLLIETP